MVVSMDFYDSVLIGCVMVYYLGCWVFVCIFCVMEGSYFFFRMFFILVIFFFFFFDVVFVLVFRDSSLDNDFLYDIVVVVIMLVLLIVMDWICFLNCKGLYKMEK